MTQPRKDKKDLVSELIGEFRAAGNQDSAFDNLAAERLGLNGTDLHCINIIENSGGLTAGELAAQAGLTSGAVTGVIDRLERAGYARRVRDPDDRRRVLVELTPEAFAGAGDFYGAQAALSERMYRRYSEEQLELFLEWIRAGREVNEREAAKLEARTRAKPGE